MEKKEPIVLLPPTFTPRNLRRGYVNKSGTVDQTKSRAFRRCAQLSKRFIHQSADMLMSPRLNNDYLAYCGSCDRDGLRKG